MPISARDHPFLLRARGPTARIGRSIESFLLANAAPDGVLVGVPAALADRLNAPALQDAFAGVILWFVVSEGVMVAAAPAPTEAWLVDAQGHRWPPSAGVPGLPWLVWDGSRGRWTAPGATAWNAGPMPGEQGLRHGDNLKWEGRTWVFLEAGRSCPYPSACPEDPKATRKPIRPKQKPG